MNNVNTPVRPASGSFERPLWEFVYGDGTKDWYNGKKTFGFDHERKALYSYGMKIARWHEGQIEILRGAKKFSVTTSRHVDDAHWWLARHLKDLIQIVMVDGVKVKLTDTITVGWSAAKERDWWVYFSEDVPEDAEVFDPSDHPEREAADLGELLRHAIGLRLPHQTTYAANHIMTYGLLRGERGRVSIGDLDLLRSKPFKKSILVYWESGIRERQVRVLNLIDGYAWSWTHGRMPEPMMADSSMARVTFSEAQKAVRDITVILGSNRIPWEYAAATEVEGKPMWASDHKPKKDEKLTTMLRQMKKHQLSYHEDQTFAEEEIEDVWNWFDVCSQGDYTGNLALKAIMQWVAENAEKQKWQESQDYLFMAWAHRTTSLWIRGFKPGSEEKTGWNDKGVTPIMKFWLKHFQPFVSDNEQRDAAYNMDAFSTLFARQDLDYGGKQYFQEGKLPAFLEETFKAVVREEIISDLEGWIDFDYGLRWIVPSDRIEQQKVWEKLADHLLPYAQFIDQGQHIAYNVDLIANAVIAHKDLMDFSLLDPNDKHQQPLIEALRQRGIEINQSS